MKNLLYLLLPLMALPATAAQLIIGIGTAANDGTGDPLRTAMTKTNTNFTELYGLYTASLIDVADGTITTNLINTANPWADNEVADAITITGSVAAGTVDATGFNGNLAPADNTMQEIAQKFDDLVAASGSVATDTIWDAAGDLVQGTGADTAARLAIGTANQILKVNAGATALEYTSSPTFGALTITGALSAGSFEFEGATADAFETSLTVVDPTADRTITLPNATGTVVVTGQQTDSFVIAISDETTALTAGVAKVTFRAPYAFTITGVRASLTTAASAGTPAFDINEAGVSVLSTVITVDATEKTSTTAAAAAVISDAAIADDAEITIDIDVAGTAAAGGKIYITHQH